MIFFSSPVKSSTIILIHSKSFLVQLLLIKINNLSRVYAQFSSMANPYRSKDGLSARPVGNSDEIQLRIDPVHGDLDDEILGLHSQVSQLKNVAQEIETEARVQNDLVSDLQTLVSRAQTGVKNSMRRLNKNVTQQKSNHVLQVIGFGLFCFSIVYFWSKLFKR